MGNSGGIHLAGKMRVLALCLVVVVIVATAKEEEIATSTAASAQIKANADFAKTAVKDIRKAQANLKEVMAAEVKEVKGMEALKAEIADAPKHKQGHFTQEQEKLAALAVKFEQEIKDAQKNEELQQQKALDAEKKVDAIIDNFKSAGTSKLTTKLSVLLGESPMPTAAQPDESIAAAAAGYAGADTPSVQAEAGSQPDESAAGAAAAAGTDTASVQADTGAPPDESIAAAAAGYAGADTPTGSVNEPGATPSQLSQLKKQKSSASAAVGKLKQVSSRLHTDTQGHTTSSLVKQLESEAEKLAEKAMVEESKEGLVRAGGNSAATLLGEPIETAELDASIDAEASKEKIESAKSNFDALYATATDATAHEVAPKQDPDHTNGNSNGNGAAAEVASSGRDKWVKFAEHAQKVVKQETRNLKMMREQANQVEANEKRNEAEVQALDDLPN